MENVGVIFTAIFLVLKLVGVISWSWWLVFLPIIIQTVIGVSALIALLVIKSKG